MRCLWSHVRGILQAPKRARRPRPAVTKSLGLTRLFVSTTGARLLLGAYGRQRSELGACLGRDGPTTAKPGASTPGKLPLESQSAETQGAVLGEEKLCCYQPPGGDCLGSLSP